MDSGLRGVQQTRVRHGRKLQGYGDYTNKKQLRGRGNRDRPDRADTRSRPADATTRRQRPGGSGDMSAAADALVPPIGASAAVSVPLSIHE